MIQPYNVPFLSECPFGPSYRGRVGGSRGRIVERGNYIQVEIVPRPSLRSGSARSLLHSGMLVLEPYL